MINTRVLQQELENERQLNKIDDTNGDTNPYKELIANNKEKIEPLLAQMRTVINFEQHIKLHTV